MVRKIYVVLVLISGLAALAVHLDHLHVINLTAEWQTRCWWIGSPWILACAIVAVILGLLMILLKGVMVLLPFIIGLFSG